MLIVLRQHWLHKNKKGNDHIPDATSDNHQKAVFMKAKKTVRYPWYIDQAACLMPNAISMSASIRR